LALKNIWTNHKNDNKDDRMPATSLELCSILERTLNYAQTGNAKVLVKLLMSPLWVSRGLLEDGMPVFSPAMDFNLEVAMNATIRLTEWPLNKNSPGLALASWKSFLVNYGQGQLDVSSFSFQGCFCGANNHTGLIFRHKYNCSFLPDNHTSLIFGHKYDCLVLPTFVHV
jgi:hypothetical protein